jgi:methyl-accepting chemotaxis protein
MMWLAGVLIAGSVLSGWIAIGRLASATQRGLARTEQSLSSARDLAADTAASATELQRLIGVMGEGLGKTGDALIATRQVSESVRGLLDVASFINSVDTLSARLKNAESTLAEVEIDLAEASGAIQESGPVLDKTVVDLQAIPKQLDQSIAAVKSSGERVGQQVWLWRMAMAAGGAALLVMLALIAQLRAAVNRGVQPTLDASV